MSADKLLCLAWAPRRSVHVGLQRRRLILAALVGAGWIAATEPSASAEPPIPREGVPKIGLVEREFLSKLARRRLRDFALGRPVVAADYVPLALRDLRAEVVVRLRQEGYLLNTGVAPEGAIAESVPAAALAAFATIKPAESQDALRLANELLVEIEVLGPTEAIDVETDWTAPRALDAHVEPGVHGFVFVSGNLRRRLCPTEIITGDAIVADALTATAQQIKAAKPQIADMKLLRFRTLHWYEAPGADHVVSLHRGLTVLDDAEVTAEILRSTIDALAAYMIYRQQPDGLFSYQFEPGSNRYSVEDNDVRQTGAVAAMAAHARWSGRSASRAAADAGIRRLLQGLTPVPDREEAAFIATPDRGNKLGTTALLALALAEHPNEESYADTRRRLVRGMLWLQRPSGMFLTAFPPAIDIDAQEYFPGEALLAMAMDYAHEPTAPVLEAFDRAISFYREYFKNRPSPAFVPWQVLAYVGMSTKTKRQDYTDYVFELTDWLAKEQLTAENCRWPEMWGGIASYQAGRAGVSTAAYLEAFADALQLARRTGDKEREARYERVVRAAARFVMQLQVRKEEAYHIPSAQDAVGGIRTSPSLNLLRIDHCQHALIALMKTHDVLFGGSG
jgi:hypothetical protein